MCYLKDKDRSIASLQKHPLVKSVFLKHKTTLLSSAPAERLFSFAGMTLSPKRSSMCDKTFERLVVLIRVNRATGDRA